MIRTSLTRECEKADEKWVEQTPDVHRWKAKYYKVISVILIYEVSAERVLQGLGTSKDEDARDYFSRMNKHMIPFGTIQHGERDLIELAFSKKKADDRKEWLRGLEVGLQRSYSCIL